MRNDVAQVHVDNINNRLFINVAVIVAPNVYAAYSMPSDTVSEYAINRTIDKADKLTPQRAHELFPTMQSNGFIYQV